MATPNKPKIFGLDKKHEVAKDQLYRNTKKLDQRVSDILLGRDSAAILMLTMACMVFVFPYTYVVGLLGAFAIMLFRHFYLRETLPVRMPVASGVRDLNDPEPGRKEFRKARGIVYLGNDIDTNQEIWISREDLLTHMLLFGTTGAGKTYTLTGLSANYLLMGGGLVYVDAKAAISLPYDIMALCCALGREDDFLLLNYITGNQTIQEKTKYKLSNTTNPTAVGSAENLASQMESLLGGGGDAGGNQVFRDRATSLMQVALRITVDLRNAGVITLGPNTLRGWMTLPQLMAASNKTKDDSNKPNISNPNSQKYIKNIRESTMEALNAYLSSIAGFDFNKPPTGQGESANEQFGFAQMYWTKALGTLSDTYRHIYWTDVGDIDQEDVVMQRRIEVVLLPPLEKSPDEMLQLGNLTLSALKGAAAANLESLPEGLRQERDRPMPACPAGMIMDEYAYINTKGFAVMPAQARGLGIGMVFAGQDYAGFKRADANEAEQVVSNTNVKIGMKMEDPSATFELFKSLAGEGRASMKQGDTANSGAILSPYTESQQVQLEKIERVVFRDFKQFIEGEAIVFFGDKMIRANLVSHAIKKDNNMELRLNRFLPMPDILPPDFESVEETYKKIEIFNANQKNRSEKDLILSAYSRALIAVKEEGEYESPLDALMASHLVCSNAMDVIEDEDEEGSGSSAGGPRAKPVKEPKLIVDETSFENLIPDFDKLDAAAIEEFEISYSEDDDDDEDSEEFISGAIDVGNGIREEIITLEPNDGENEVRLHQRWAEERRKAKEEQRRSDEMANANELTIAGESIGLDAKTASETAEKLQLSLEDLHNSYPTPPILASRGTDMDTKLQDDIVKLNDVMARLGLNKK